MAPGVSLPFCSSVRPAVSRRWCVCWTSEIHGHKPVAASLSEIRSSSSVKRETVAVNRAFSRTMENGTGKSIEFGEPTPILSTCLSPRGRWWLRTGPRTHWCRVQSYRCSFIVIFPQPLILEGSHGISLPPWGPRDGAAFEGQGWPLTGCWQTEPTAVLWPDWPWRGGAGSLGPGTASHIAAPRTPPHPWLPCCFPANPARWTAGPVRPSSRLFKRRQKLGWLGKCPGFKILITKPRVCHTE